MSWQMVKLKDCCDVVGGATPKRNVASYWGGDIPWITPKDISNLNSPFIHEASEYITSAGYKAAATHILPAGTILLTSRAPIGNVAIAGIELCTNQGFKSLIPGINVHNKYLYHCIKKLVPKLELLGNGATFKEVSKAVVENFEIPLPPFEEQKRIARILDKSDSIRQKREQAIQQADNFLRTIFLDMFGDPVENPKGWKVKPLISLVVGKLQNGAYFPKDKYSKDGVEMVHMADAFYDVIQRGNLKRVRANDVDIKKYSLTHEDLMISRRSLNYEGAAKPSLIPQSDEPLIFESSMIRLTPDKKQIDKLFLFHYLTNPLVKDHFIRKFVTGATIKGINQKNLEQVRILVPPMELQKKFSDIVNMLETYKSKLSGSENSSIKLFTALSQRAFYR